MAALISGGINALQGKRGSDLLKSTVRDTAIAYALGPSGMAGGQAGQQAAGQGISQLGAQTGKTAVEKEMLKELAMEEAGKQTFEIGRAHV